MNRALTHILPIPRLFDLFSWWFAELAAIRQDLIRLIPRKPLHYVDVIVARNGTTDRLKNEILGHLKGSDRVPLIRLCLSSDACLIRHLRLPAAAVREIERILVLELEHGTPFSAEDVFHSYHICAEQSSKDQLSVDHIIVKRKLLEPLLEFLCANRCRFSPQVKILREGSSITVELLRNINSFTPDRRRLRTLRSCGVAAAAAALMVLLAGIYWRQSMALADLSHNILAQKKRAVAVRAKLSRLESAAGQASTLRLLRNDTISIVAIWDELTRLIPDGAWLSELSIEKNSVVLSGFAQSSAELLAKLEASPFFEHAGFTSPVIMAPGEALEIFSIRLDINAPSSSQQPSRLTEVR